jgi:hypothetical protein
MITVAEHRPSVPGVGHVQFIVADERNHSGTATTVIDAVLGKVGEQLLIGGEESRAQRLTHRDWSAPGLLHRLTLIQDPRKHLVQVIRGEPRRVFAAVSVVHRVEGGVRFGAKLC